MAFAGIGKTQNNFFTLLGEYGCNVVKEQIDYPDHYQYKRTELQEDSRNLQKKIIYKLLQQKRIIHRIEKSGTLEHIKFLKLKLEIENQRRFDQSIIKRLHMIMKILKYFTQACRNLLIFLVIIKKLLV